MDERETLRGALLLVQSFALALRAGNGAEPSHTDWPSVKAVMELVPRLGISPHLSPGVGISRPQKPLTDSAAAAIAQHSSNFEHLAVSGLEKGGDLGILFVSAELLASIVLPDENSDAISCTSLSPMAQLVMDSYLSDIMAAYLQLEYGPPPQDCILTEDGKRLVTERLLQLTEKLPVGHVVEACFILLNQSSPPPPTWLKSEVGKLLSKLVMRQGGVAAVLERLVGGAVKGNIQVHERIAAHLAKIPKTISKAEEYYRAICPQLSCLFLLNAFQSECNECDVAYQTLQNIRVTSALLACNMIVSEPDFSYICLIRPLLRPLLEWVSNEKETPRPEDTFKVDLHELQFEGHSRERALVDCLLQVQLLITTGHKDSLFVKEQLFMRMRHIAPFLLRLHYQLEAYDTATSPCEHELHRVDVQPNSACKVEKCTQPADSKLEENPVSKEFMNKGIIGKFRHVMTDIVLALISQPLQQTLPLILTFLWDLNAVVLKLPEESWEACALNLNSMHLPSLVRYLSRLTLQTENWALAVAIMGEILHKILDLRRCNQQGLVSNVAGETHQLIEGFKVFNESVGVKALEHDAKQASVLIKALLDDETALGDEEILGLIFLMVPSVLNGLHSDSFTTSSTCAKKSMVMMDMSLSLEKICKSECISELLKKKASVFYNNLNR